jgi:hypothetical protein
MAIKRSIDKDAEHEIIGVSDDNHIGRCRFPAPGFYPEVKDVNAGIRSPAVEKPSNLAAFPPLPLTTRYFLKLLPLATSG